MVGRHLDLNEVVNEALAFFVANIGLAVRIVLLANLPFFIWLALSVIEPSQWFTPVRYRSARDLLSFANLAGVFVADRWNGQLVASIMIATFSSLIQAGGLAHALAERAHGRDVAAIDAVRAALARFGDLLLANAVPALIVVAAVAVAIASPVFGTAAFALLMLALVPRWLVATQAVMVEGVGGLAALRRSFELASGRYWYVLAIVVIAEIVLGLASLLPIFAQGMTSVLLDGEAQRAADVLIAFAAAVVIDPFYNVVVMFVYFQLRRRAARAAYR